MIKSKSEDSFGSLLESTYNGTKKLLLSPVVGERGFIEDMDEIKISGFAQADGYRVGFGECVGKIMPASI
jgi:fumarylacetoacetase